MGNSQTTMVEDSNINRILEIVNQGVLSINCDGTVVTYNRAAESILGVDQEKVLNHHYSENFDDEVLKFSINESLKNKHSAGLLRVKIDAHREIEVDTYYLENKGLIILIRDITAYRKREISAQRKSRMQDLGDMASMVAHEIRNPLGGIKGFASLLERDLKEQPNLQKMATHIVKASDGLNEIVTRVVNYSKPLDGEFKPTNLIAVVEDLKQHVENSELNVESKHKELTLSLDEAAFKQAILNLLKNAQQAMPNGGKIKLGIDIVDDEVILTLSDTGCGISEENLKKAFTPFFTTRSDGSGFGLSETHKIVQAHDGEIEVDSVVDEGTTFTIKLPYIKD